MLSEMDVREIRLYWQSQEDMCEHEAFKSTVQLIITVLNRILEIEEGE